MAQTGRWLTMNGGDVDGDGKIDLVLGNFPWRLPSASPKQIGKMSSVSLIEKHK